MPPWLHYWEKKFAYLYKSIAVWKEFQQTQRNWDETVERTQSERGAMTSVDWISLNVSFRSDPGSATAFEHFIFLSSNGGSFKWQENSLVKGCNRQGLGLFEVFKLDASPWTLSLITQTSGEETYVAVATGQLPDAIFIPHGWSMIFPQPSEGHNFLRQGSPIMERR